MIIDPVTLVGFVGAGLALNITPGADMMFCFAQGLRGGPRPAVAASAGVSAGSMVNIIAAGAGLGALVAAHPTVFEAIRWAGVIYLLWLAYKALRQPVSRPETPSVRPARAFRDGMIVNITNPKVIFFILAFVPQFVDPARGPVFLQFLVFGAIFATSGFVVNALVGSFAGGLGRGMARSTKVEKGLRYASASVFGALALKLAWEFEL